MTEEGREDDVRELREQLIQIRLAVTNLMAILQEKGILRFSDMLELRRRIAQDQEQLDRQPEKPPPIPWWSRSDPAD